MDKATAGQVSEPAAEVYEEFFVPALFAQWTEQALDLAGVGPGDIVLDVGCGTGVVSRAAAQRIGTSGRVCAVDPNPGMRAVARRLSPDLEVRDGVAEDLPFGDAEFDRVLCTFALMFFTDAAAGLREIARVLRPGGVVVVLTWASVGSSAGYAAMVELLRRLFGQEAARALLAPFSIGTPDLLAKIVGDVFPGVQVDLLQGQAQFPSVESWVRTDIKGWTLRDLIDDSQYRLLQAEAGIELNRFAGPNGQVMFPAPALVAHATR